MALNAQQQGIKDEFIRLRGGWNAAWDAVLELDPDFMRAYSRFPGVPWRTNHLDALTIGHGATAEEILEVMEITSTLGMHAVTTAMPILMEEAAAIEA